jgi:hypothetical protein
MRKDNAPEPWSSREFLAGQVRWTHQDVKVAFSLWPAHSGLLHHLERISLEHIMKRAIDQEILSCSMQPVSTSPQGKAINEALVM